MDDLFEKEKKANIAALGDDGDLKSLSLEWIARASRHKYSYNFTWLGRPIIQFPQDIVALQEIHWRVRPDLVIETGIARGGSLVFHASMIELTGVDGLVLGVDVDIRDHNRKEIEGHPLFGRIRMIEGSSTDEAVVRQVLAMAQGRKAILVVLDSNHTHSHVLRELQLYAPLVTRGSYLVVCDTIVEDLPADFFPDRAWSKSDNPRTAVREFLRTLA